MTAPRFSRFTTRLRQLPVRIARRSLVCENSRISIPSLPQIVYLTEWSREPEPRALLPRVADPSATTHGAETSGAPVLGATPDGDRPQRRRRPPRPREHGLRLAVDQRLSQKRQCLKGPQGNHPGRAAGQRRPIVCFSPPSARSRRPRRDSQRYPRARCRSFFINRSHPYRRRSQCSHF